MPITQLKCDAHTHTLQSLHAYSTIAENIEEASAIGLELLGSTDHFGAPFIAFDPRPDEYYRAYQFWINQRVWPRVWRGVKVMRGCEADIVDIDGHLYGYDINLDHTMIGKPLSEPMTLKDLVFERLDYVIASIHSPMFTLDTTSAQNTQMYINALQDPKVLVLGHIGRLDIDYDIDAIVTAARDLHKLIEVNEHTFDHSDGKRCKRIAERCAELGCKIIVSTDAHISYSLGRFPNSIAMLNSIGFPPELIATRTAASFEIAYEEAGFGTVKWDEGSQHSQV